MATVKYIVKGKTDSSTIYLRLVSGKNIDIRLTTGLSVNYKNWSTTTNLPKERNSESKNLTSTLRSLEADIYNKLADAQLNNEIINSKWLKHQIGLFFGRVQDSNEYSNVLTDHIEKIIKEGVNLNEVDTEVKLSVSRLKAYRGLSNTVLDYEKFTNSKLLIKDIGKSFVRDFRKYLNSKTYGVATIDKKVMDIKTVCINASTYGIQINTEIINVKIRKKKNDYINYLTPQELKQIENKTYKTESLGNVKKWLLLGTMVGQRGNDLLNITEENIEYKYGLKMIVLTQQKTKKQVELPYSPQMENLLKDGFPYKISIQKFNEYIKDVCKIAKINTITKGYLFDKEKQRNVLGEFEKWQLISSHDLRRGFATNNYGKMPTPLIMSITGHASEKSLMVYIGEKNNVFAQQLHNYYLEQTQLQKKETKLNVVKSKQA